MNTKELYREILNDHNVNPAHKTQMDGATLELHGVNPSCGDNIVLYLKTKDGIITDGSYTGSGCAISQASVDMMLDLVIGKTTEEAQKLYDIFTGMIHGTASEEQIPRTSTVIGLPLSIGLRIVSFKFAITCPPLSFHLIHFLCIRRRPEQRRIQACKP